MNLFSRLSDLLALDFRSFTESTIDVDTEVERILAELEAGLNAARRYAATVIATERRLRWEIQQNRREASRWQYEARTFPCHQHAHQALDHTRECDQRLNVLKSDYAEAHELADRVRQYVRALTAYVHDLRCHEKTLADWQRIAAARDELA